MTSQDSFKKFSLFLDTSYGINIGLLNEKYEWLEFDSFTDKKSSEVIHAYINEFFEKYKISSKEIELFLLSGPGSYTGLRVSEGIAQIFEIDDCPVYSFNIFTLGSILSQEIEKDMTWIFPAFKGEAYVRAVDADKGVLIDESSNFNDTYITHGENKYLPLAKCNSLELIKRHSKKLFSQVRKLKCREEIFYFRSLDKEFSKQ